MFYETLARIRPVKKKNCPLIRGVRLLEYPLIGENTVPSIVLASGSKPIGSLYIELNLQNVKMLINCFYNPHKAEIDNYLAVLNRFLGKHSTKYEKNFILGEFNVKNDYPKMWGEVYNFDKLVVP